MIRVLICNSLHLISEDPYFSAFERWNRPACGFSIVNSLSIGAVNSLQGTNQSAELPHDGSIKVRRKLSSTPKA